MSVGHARPLLRRRCAGIFHYRRAEAQHFLEPLPQAARPAGAALAPRLAVPQHDGVQPVDDAVRGVVGGTARLLLAARGGRPRHGRVELDDVEPQEAFAEAVDLHRAVAARVLVAGKERP